jgi:hypothetical protein
MKASSMSESRTDIGQSEKGEAIKFDTTAGEKETGTMER